MKKVKAIKTGALALAAAMSLGGMVTSGTAQADVSASFSASNMYLWRGQNLTKDGAQVAGSLDYAHSSGAYAGIWTTTETEGHETDLYLGFGGEAGGFTYDISYWKYLYNEDCTGSTAADSCDATDNDLSEYVVSLGYNPVTLSAYVNAESSATDYIYYTLDVALGKFNFQYGVWDIDSTTADPNPNNYSHLTVSYAATDELSFAVSVASNDSNYDNKPTNAGTDAFGVEEDPLFQVTYSKSFDL